MERTITLSVFLLRIGLAIIFLYSSISKIMDPHWSAAPYLAQAQTFPALYQWFAAPERIGLVNGLNEWGQFLIGLALLLGAGVRIASIGGILMMLLYYFPILHFPYVGQNYFIVDEHIMFILIFIFFLQVQASDYLGFGGFVRHNTKIGDQKWVSILLQ